MSHSLHPSGFRLAWLLVVPIAGLALAMADAQDPPASPDPSGRPAAAESTVARRPLSPMMVEIRQALEGERRTVDELAAALDAARDEDEAMAILRRIHEAKRGAQIEVLRIQARHARAAGRTEAAAGIDAAIERLLAPPPPPVAQERPAPPDALNR